MTYHDAPDGSRLAVQSDGQHAVIAIGGPEQFGGLTRSWTRSTDLTRNDLMIFAEQLLAVARELPMEVEPYE